MPADQVLESTSTSLPSSISTNPSSNSNGTESTEDTQPTSSAYSISSTISDRQLCHRHPINYNEMLLKRLHRKPQVRSFNNIQYPYLQLTQSQKIHQKTKKIETPIQKNGHYLINLINSGP